MGNPPISVREATTVEVTMALGVIIPIVILVTIVISPTREFAKARNNKRTSDVDMIADAAKRNSVDNGGFFNCAAGPLPLTPKRMGSAQGEYNIGHCLVPVYISVMPYDPEDEKSHYNGLADYDTAYTITQNPITRKITVEAPFAELKKKISVIK